MRSRLSRSRRYKSRRLVASDSSSSEEEVSNDIEEAWKIVVETIPKLLFSGDAACFTNVDTKQIYCGVQVSYSCLMSLKTIYDQRFDAHGQLGYELAMYKGLNSVIGQLIRSLVASGKISTVGFRSLWKAGKHFRAANHRDAIKVFIGHFKENNAASTVSFKAAQLETFFDHAESFFVRTGDVSQEKKAAGIADYLRGTCASYKRESRKRTSLGKSHLVRSRLCNVLLTADFGAISSIASSKLNALRQSFTNMVKKAPSTDRRKLLYEYFDKKPKAVQKWSINFISFLVLNGGGQRSQAYCQAQCPPLSHIRALSKDVERVGCFSLPTLREKRTRETDIPQFVLPGAVYPFVAYHAEYIRPYLLEKFGHEKLPLLIDTRSPRAFKEHSILSTVRSFLKNEDPELGSLTLMNIRSSYATMAITMYQSGKMFEEMNEDSFITFLAKIMNTSKEMIKETYTACTKESTLQAASRLANLVQDLEYGRGESENEEREVEISTSDEDICEAIDPPNKHVMFKL